MLQLAALIACMTHREMQHRPSAAAALTPGTIWNDPLHDPRVFVERFCSNHIPNKSPCIDHISNSANNQLTKATSLYCSNGVCPLMYPTKAHDAWLTWTSRSQFFPAACRHLKRDQCLPPPASHWLLWLRKHEWFSCDSDEDFPAENRAALIGSSASQSLREQVRSGSGWWAVNLLRRIC